MVGYEGGRSETGRREKEWGRVDVIVAMSLMLSEVFEGAQKHLWA